MEFGWIFLWLGVALLGLGVLLLRVWWRERRFEDAALTLAAGLLLVASSVQQLFVFVMAITNRWEVDSTPFVLLSIVAAALATAVWIALAHPARAREPQRGASRPQRIHELEVLGAIARLSSQAGSVEQVGGNILETAAAPAVGADAAVLLLYDLEHRRLNAKAASGIPEDLWRTFEIEVSRHVQPDAAGRGEAARRQRRLRGAPTEDAARPCGRSAERARRPDPPRRAARSGRSASTPSPRRGGSTASPSPSPS